MAKLTTYALAGALALAFVPVAGFAADLPEPPLLEPVPEPVEFGSAWYLRGDVGYKTYRDPSVKFAGYKYKDEEFDDTGVVGGGVGYKFNQWFRMDATLDYEFPSDFGGKLRCYSAAPAYSCNTQKRYSEESAEISAWTGLVNAYADIGTWHGITPYVGAGIGLSRIKISDYDFKNPKPLGGLGHPVSSGGSQPGGSDWSFSWALMAGVGYNVTDNLIIDAGYRYLNLGDAKSGKAKGFGVKKAIKFDDIEAHEFRVGFRYLID